VEEEAPLEPGEGDMLADDPELGPRCIFGLMSR